MGRRGDAGGAQRCGRAIFVAALTSFFTAGLRWLCHRSRHCLPIREGRSAAMRLQLEGPCFSTSSWSLASSSAVHACFRTALFSPPLSADASPSSSPSASPSSSSAAAIPWPSAPAASPSSSARGAADSSSSAGLAAAHGEDGARSSGVVSVSGDALSHEAVGEATDPLGGSAGMDTVGASHWMAGCSGRWMLSRSMERLKERFRPLATAGGAAVSVASGVDMVGSLQKTSACVAVQAISRRPCRPAERYITMMLEGVSKAAKGSSRRDAAGS